MVDVYVLSYARPMLTGILTGECIGYYSSLAKLEEAKERLRSRPGFRDYPEGFYINCYRVDEEYDDPTFFKCWDPDRRPAAVLGEAVGIDAIERPFTVLLPRNTPLPASIASLVPTREDNQAFTRVTLLAGDPARASEARQLGELVVPDLPPAPRLVIRIPIWVVVDERGGVSIAARHPRTGEVLSAQAGTVAFEHGRADPGTGADGGGDTG